MRDAFVLVYWMLSDEMEAGHRVVLCLLRRGDIGRPWKFECDRLFMMMIDGSGLCLSFGRALAAPPGRSESSSMGTCMSCIHND